MNREYLPFYLDHCFHQFLEFSAQSSYVLLDLYPITYFLMLLYMLFLFPILFFHCWHIIKWLISLYQLFSLQPCYTRFISMSAFVNFFRVLYIDNYISRKYTVIFFFPSCVTFIFFPCLVSVTKDYLYLNMSSKRPLAYPKSPRKT